tara:strand:+ start:87 stop:497 length:411 start_codon:yes stop_codon:yes gene_type:complete
MNGDKDKKTIMDFLPDSLRTFGEKSADADTLTTLEDKIMDAYRKKMMQEELLNMLKEGGAIGKQGRAFKDSLDTTPLLGSNETAEQDSLQQDAIRRMQEGGIAGKSGRKGLEWLRKQDWLKNILRGFSAIAGSSGD